MLNGKRGSKQSIILDQLTTIYDQSLIIFLLVLDYFVVSKH